MTTVCYKLNTPIYYNKGTKYETTCDHFLSYYTYKNEEEAQKEVDEINRTKPEKLWNGETIDWTKVDHFFVNNQEAMH